MNSRRFLMFLSGLLLAMTSPVSAQSTHETIDKIQPRMVKIFGSGGLKNLQGYGTGFLVSPQGHIVTVWSHVLDGQAISVMLNDGRRFEAKVLGAEPQLDVAVLQIQEDDLILPYFKAEDFGTAGPGTRILGFSNMFKVATGDEQVSVLHGVIAAKTKLDARRGRFEIPYDGAVYIVDAITNNPGAGGGVLTTRDGKLLGMIGKEIRNAQSNTWINYTVPITELKEVIEALIKGEYLSREKKLDDSDNPNRYQPVDFGILMVPDVLYRTPAYVDAVITGTPAEKAGLQQDDLVLFVNDELIQSVKTLDTQLGYLEGGDTLRMVIRRGSKLINLQLPVHKKEELKE